MVKKNQSLSGFNKTKYTNMYVLFIFHRHTVEKVCILLICRELIGRENPPYI